MSVATEITRLQNAKASIKSSIEAKGVSVPSSTTLDGYSTLIDNIPSGATINGSIENILVQDGNITKGDMVAYGTNVLNGQITSDLRNYVPSAVTITDINNFYSQDDSKYLIAQATTNSNPSINLLMPTREQLDLPSGRKVIDFTIEIKFSFSTLDTSSTKQLNFLRFKKGNTTTSFIYQSNIYTSDASNTFPKIVTIEKPNEELFTDDIDCWGIRLFYGRTYGSIYVYYLKYTIIYEDNGKIVKYTSNNNRLLGVANQNGVQGDTIQVYVPNVE